MGTKFQVRFTRHNGNLHVHPRGDLDGSTAWQLIRLLKKKYDGKGNVVIDTSRLRTILPFGRSTFQGQLHLSRIPAGNLVFLGRQGDELAPAGSKVQAPPKNTGAVAAATAPTAPALPMGRKQTNWTAIFASPIARTNPDSGDGNMGVSLALQKWACFR